MVRALLPCGFLLVSAALAGAAPAPPDDGGKERGDVLTPLNRSLKGTVRFGGFEKDERLTLRDCLEQLTELYDVSFLVNEKAFKQEKVDEVLNSPITAKAPIPRMTNVSLETVLRELLARVPSNSGATFVVRERHIEITTVQALSMEVRGHNNGPLPPLVHANIDRLLLGEALRCLADQTGFNVVIDPRAGDKVKTAVTARLHNVPIDSAVRLLADMAGLKSVQIDNALYVTTADNAKALQEEQDKRRLGQSGTGPEAPQKK